jgi:large subunit ribosomal protein L1
MIKYSKRILNSKNLIIDKIYNINDGIFLLKKISNANFDESFEIHLKLNLKGKIEQIKSTVNLPYNIPKKIRISIFENEIFKEEYLSLGAYSVGIETIIQKIETNKIDFDILLTTPTLMPKLIKYNNILNSKKLLPSLKSGTISFDLKKTLNEFKKGKVEYKLDKNGNIHSIFGKKSFSIDNLQENFISLYNSILKDKSNLIKKNIIKGLYICSTMSPSIKIDLNSF